MTIEVPRASALPRLRASAKERLIVALDFPTLADATEMVGALAPVISWFKVGSELFTAAGPEAVAMVRAFGGNIFLDLKYHDIPNTVRGAVRAAARLGVALLSVHIAAGEAALRAAVEASQALSEPRTPNLDPRPLILGITVLTSHEAIDTGAIVEAARLGRACGLHGVVASAREATTIKDTCGREFIVLTPGIRPAGSPRLDQRRILTPAEAITAGADFLVVGRPITEASDPRRSAETVLTEIQNTLDLTLG